MCYKQAGLMQDLRARLINGGFSEVEFRILSTESTANDTDGLWRLRYAARHPTIPVLQEIPSNLLWYKLLDGAVDHILVLDRCSRLTYQVITPWSILHFPYVKAAILSTYEDDPCGPCTVSLEDATSLDQNTTSNSTIDDLSIMDNSTLDLNENASIPNTATNNSAASIFETVDVPSSVEFPYSSSSEQTLSSDIPAYFSNVTTDSNSSVIATTDTPDADAYENNKTYDINTADIQENVVIDDTLIVDTYVQTSPDQMKATLAPLTERADGTVPVRVVMHSPHLHRYINGTVTQHEYLELQTGNPDYHGHLVNDNNLVHSNSNDEQTIKRKKYKGQRRKGKLRPEAIQAETQNNYEDTKIKHHRDKERPEKKKQKIKSDEHNVSEEAASTPTPPPLEDPTMAQPVHKDTGEDNAEVASLEIPQEIQEHYDYRSMPFLSGKQLHKPLRVTEVVSAVSGAATESTSNVGEQEQIEEIEHRDTMYTPATNETRASGGIISKAMTSDKQIIKATEKIKDHKKWKSNPSRHHPQNGNAENENDLTELKAPAVNASITSNGTSPQDTETSNSDQQPQKQKAQSHDTNILRDPHSLEDDTGLNVIDSEEHKKYKPNKAGKEMDALQVIGSIENQPTLGLSNEDDDDSKKQIIQHYSQLLKWIHYTLPETRN